jgi:hypothetical protein
MADKVTMNEFGAKLKNGDYSNAGAARKAVGRFGGWTDKAKAQARNMIDAHFGAEPAVKPAKRGPKPKRAIKPVARLVKGKTRGAARGDEVLLPAPTFGPLLEMPLRLQAQQLLEQVNLASRTIRRLHNIVPTLEISDSLQLMVEFNNNALKVLGQNVKPVELVKVEAAPARKAKGKAARGNGEGTLETALESAPAESSNVATI